MENRRDPQAGSESKTRLVEQINSCLRSGDYARALDLRRGAAAEFPDDAELSELEKLAQDGVERNTEANRLITQSQELFAQRKSAEAIQLLRKAHELDKSNALARAILANALVEHAHSIVETDWWEAAKLAKQALELNPAHPTAKTIRSLIRDRKETSSIEEWISQVHKLQSSGDLFAALSLVAEGLDVHSRDSKLLLLQDAIQRDQDGQRRQARRGDLEELRRMESQIDGAVDVAAKKALAERIQGVAAKYWTDGEILAVANGLLHRLGLAPQESSTASPRSKGAPVIFHVPRPSAPEAPRPETSPIAPSKAPSSPGPGNQISASQIPADRASADQASASPVSADQIPTNQIPTNQLPVSEVPINPIPSGNVPAGTVPPSKVLPSKIPPGVVPPGKVLTTPPEAKLAQPIFSPAELSASVVKVAAPASQPKQPAKSNLRTIIFVCAAVIVVVAVTFFLARRHHASPEAKAPAVAPTVSAPLVSAPAVTAPIASAPTQATPEPSLPAAGVSSDTAAKVAPDDQPPAESGSNLGTLVVVAGQDNARVFLNGKLQRQLTQAGQLRLPNLELKDYVVQVSKNGFLDPPQQTVRIRKGEQSRLIFNLQPQPRMASLTIKGGAPGTTVFVDQAPVGTIQADGTLSVSTVNPGDHTVELRKERFLPRQFKKQFVAGGAVSLAAADATLEAAPGELKITFTPADATVAIVKGDLLKMVSSGVPLDLPAGTYTLTARTAERFTRSSTLEVIAGQSKTLDLSLAPTGMSSWDDPGAWKQERESFNRKGGDFVLYGVVPTSGAFIFSAMLTKGHPLQWVLNYSDPKNYVLFQMDDNNFYRTVVRNGEKTDKIIVPDINDKTSVRTLQIRVSPTELVHQIKRGDRWTVLDRWTQPGANLSLGKFGFYIPGNDQVTLSSFAHYADLNLR